jgi:hypothetical protein
MMIIGFEDADGNPIVKSKEEQEKFLEMSHLKKEDVMFADDIPANVFIGLDLLNKEKTPNKK